MKKAKLYEQFLNEGIQFGKKGIAAKIKASLEYAKEQLASGQEWYDKIVAELEKMKPNRLDYENHQRQYSPKREDYDLFNPNYARSLATEIGKVVAKYKPEEVAKSSTPAAAVVGTRSGGRMSQLETAEEESDGAESRNGLEELEGDEAELQDESEAVRGAAE